MKTHTQLFKRCFVILLFFTLVLVFPNSPAADTLEDATQAHNAGNYKKAFEILKPLAEQGDAKAQIRVGLMYGLGLGVERDDKQAVHWHKKALNILEPLAEQGDADAQYLLGRMYEEGWGVEQDNKQAVHWYEKAAEQGDRDGQYWLAGMYEKGLGVEQDSKQAVHWYEKAAEQGFLPAQSDLAGMYFWGNGVEQSDLEAYKWYSLVSAQYKSDRSFLDKLFEGLIDIYIKFKLSSAQKKEADEWVKNWKPKPNKSP